MIFATGNENKMVEIREILGDLPLEIQSMKEAGVYADVVEDGTTFEENALINYQTEKQNQNLIDRLEGVPDEERTARFVCAIAAVFPDGREFVVRGTVEGRIGYEEKGENGFGYDPIFYLPERGMTTAELSPEEKNLISHRGNALRKMKEILEKEEVL